MAAREDSNEKAPPKMYNVTSKTVRKDNAVSTRKETEAARLLASNQRPLGRNAGHKSRVRIRKGHFGFCTSPRKDHLPSISKARLTENRPRDSSGRRTTEASC